MNKVKPYVVITRSRKMDMKFASIIEATSPEEAAEIKAADSSAVGADVVAVTLGGPSEVHPLAGYALTNVTIEKQPIVKTKGYY